MIPAPRAATAGFTLVEVLVALVIFAVIGVAGFSMLDQVLRTQGRTDGRLERLAEQQRFMHVLTGDFAQAVPGSLRYDPAEGEAAQAVTVTSGSVRLRYRVASDVLVREVMREGTPVMQPLLSGVMAADWQFYKASTGWTDDWPPSTLPNLPGAAAVNPQAVAVTVTLAAGQMRRVALLPDAPG